MNKYISPEKTFFSSVQLNDGNELIVCFPELCGGTARLADIHLVPSEGGNAVFLSVSLLGDPKSEIKHLGFVTVEGMDLVRPCKYKFYKARFELVAPGLQVSLE